MKDHRMFSLFVIDSDAFLDMPLSAQAVYFHLCMRADDDGFVDNPKKIQRMIKASDDDYRLLFAKQFLITFDTGVIVIRHWRLHNTIRKDMYKRTIYTREAAMIEADENKTYQLRNVNVTEPLRDCNVNCTNNVTEPLRTRDGNVSLREDKLSKDNINKDIGISIDSNKGGKGGIDIINESDLSDPLKEKIIAFLEYRREIKKPYKSERSVRILVKKAHEQEQQYGSVAVIDCIDKTIQNGWQGIFWERISQAGQKVNRHTQKLIDIGEWGKQYE